MSSSEVLYGFNASSVDLVNFSSELARNVTCYLQATTNEYDGDLGVRISAIFVILIVSTAATIFPVLAVKVPKLGIPIYVYLFARYFGAGVIVATAFVHLLDPAYAEIGPQTCVGMTGGWASYSWPPALSLTSCMLTFLLDFVAERYVESKYGVGPEPDAGDIVTGRTKSVSVDAATRRFSTGRQSSQALSTISTTEQSNDARTMAKTASRSDVEETDEVSEEKRLALLEEEERSFKQQIAAFLVLEFGVIFHSVIIGLTLGTAGSEFATLYPVLVFHQSFEGLGIGARLSAIPIPRRLRWLPWVLCIAYGLTTPVSIAAGLGVAHTYNSGSYTANVVSGLLDSISSGILIYTGLVELLARDFIFNPNRTNDNKQLAFMVVSVFLGAGIMALLGKWA